MTFNASFKIIAISFLIVFCIGFILWFLFYLKSNYPGAQTLRTLSYINRGHINTSFTDNFLASARKDSINDQQEYERKVNIAFRRLGSLNNYEKYKNNIQAMRVVIAFFGILAIACVNIILKGKVVLILNIVLSVIFVFLIISFKTMSDTSLFGDLRLLNEGIVYELYEVCSQFAALGKEGHTLDEILHSISKTSVFLKNDLNIFEEDLHQMGSLEALIAMSDRVNLFSTCTEMIELSQLTYSMYSQDTDPTIMELEFSKLRDSIFEKIHVARDSACNKSLSGMAILCTVVLMIACCIFLLPFLLKGGGMLGTLSGLL